MENGLEEAVTEEKQEISIEDFKRVELTVGVVIECEKLKKSRKLLKLKVKLGAEERQIVSGISAYYTPEEMVGKTVIVATNLKEAVLCGETSQGMILAASDTEGQLCLLTCDGKISDGAVVS